MIDIKQIEVWLNDKQVGRLALTPNPPYRCVFEYSSDWLKTGFSISPFELPLTQEMKIAPYHPFEGNFGVFSDSLPDGWGRLVLHRYLAKQGINSQSLSILQQLCLVGSNGRGALEFRPDNSVRNIKEYLKFEQIAAETDAILHDDNYIGSHIEELMQRGGSPGGARPKIFVKEDDKEWLVKFRAKEDKQNIGVTEYRYSQLARLCGIEIPITKLFDNKWFGVERFDRKNGKKIHTVSVAGLLQADYTTPCIDYLHIFQISSKLSHSVEELWKIYRLMCFNVIIGNHDDHAKNFSFIYDNGWHFAPAYDILPCGQKDDYHTTSVNDNPIPNKDDIIALANRIGLNTEKANEIYEKIRNIAENYKK